MNKNDVEQFYDYLDQKETELRVIIPHGSAKSVHVNNKEDFVKECQKYNEKRQVYAGVNERKHLGTLAEDVLKIQRIPIDIDSTHPKDEAATQKELDNAYSETGEIINFIKTEYDCFPNLITMSGNGYCLFYNLDLPKEHEQQVQEFLRQLKQKFDNEKIRIDNVGDLPRIIKVAGTLSIKGTNTIERPHRICKIVQYNGQKTASKLADAIKLIQIEKKQKERKVKTSYFDILKKTDANSSERTSCVMQILESHKTWKKEEILDYIAKHTNWKNYNPKITDEKIIATLDKYAKKPNPVKHEEFQTATNQLIDFSEYEILFKNTHNHLDAFNLVTEALSLEGKEYYVLKKILTYKTESLRQQTISIRIGKSVGDNRLHVIIVGGAGKGKGQVKKIAIGKRTDCGTINAKRTHLEQLIGKIQKSYSKETEQKGYFKNKELLVDECHTLITEEDRNDAAVMSEIRKASDPYMYNLVEKKLVDTNKLSYYPETRFTLLSHNLRLPPVFFDLGTFRRFLACELKPVKISENVATNSMFEENTEHQFEEYLNSDSARFDNLEFTRESKLIIQEYIKIWNRFTLKNPNQRIRMLAQRIFISVKEFFFTIIAILHISKSRGLTDEKLTRLACFDTVHFLLNTFQLYANNSNITLSRDIWQTTNLKEAMFFEWLYQNKATNREESKITIADAQDTIGDIFGLQTKQSRSVFAKMKKDGFIDSIQSFQDSRTWLAFNPNFDGNVVFEDEEGDDLFSFLEKEKINLHGGKNEV